MKFRLSPLRTAALVAASLFLAPQGMAADAQNGIVVYNAQHENLVKSWVDGFTKETGIKVTLRNGDDSELGNQLVQEGSASPADVFLTENSPSMVLVDNAKLFAPLDAATLQQVSGAVPSAAWALDRHCRAQHRFCLQSGENQRGAAAAFPDGSGKTGVERALGGFAIGG